MFINTFPTLKNSHTIITELNKKVNVEESKH